VHKQQGPFAYDNWKAQINGSPSHEAYEYPLFTDAHIIGEITTGCGPYQIFNTVPMTKRDALTPSIVLRAEYHGEYQHDDSQYEKTDIQWYHGGLLSDEIAALLALCLGIRLKSGGYTRHFRPHGDPRGYPTEHEIGRNPVLPSFSGMSVNLPRVQGERSLDMATPLRDLPLLTPGGATALVRAARQYQDAVWIAEAEPELSWLMFVSALEIAAGYWRSKKESPIERLTAAQPELQQILSNAGGQQLVEQVAEHIADRMGAAKKFTDFVLEFLPEPPLDRPPIAFQHSWDRETFKESLKIIYNWRSKALHGGTPFPLPMCMPPFRMAETYLEKPTGLATKARGAIWVAKDTPINLHTFEYIVRNALLKWWNSMISSK
jgi:hypothetical protein